jgi:hypothetical protein
MTTLPPLEIGARVTALASYRHGTGNNTLTLLVGTKCRVNTQGIPEAILRFDFDLSGGAPSAIGDAVGTWALPQAAPQTGFVPANILDIAIDAITDKAYVAANARGVYRISLTAGGLQDDSGNGWPITKSTSSPEIFAAVDVVHLTSPTKSLLIVTRNGVGGDPASQIYGVCGSPLNCDSHLFPDMVDIVGKGVSLYDLGSNPVLRVDALPRVNLGNPVKAKARPPQGNNFLIDVADGQGGLVVLSAAPSTVDSNQYAVTIAGAYDKSVNEPSGGKFLPGS